MKLNKVILFMAFFMALFLAGVAFAAPTKIDDRSEYSTSLNTIAAVTMNWYGSLIASNQIAVSEYHFNTAKTGDHWSEYRSQYPQNISQIIITDTDLLKLDKGNGYQFKVESKIIYRVNNETQTLSLKETFVFKDSTYANQGFPLIKSITQDAREETQNIKTDGYNRSHYKVREFTYAWLTYIDGVNSLKPTMNAKAWLDKATYLLNMGAEKSSDSIDHTLAKKKQLLAKGGHLLRSLDIKQRSSDKDTFVIDLI